MPRPATGQLRRANGGRTCAWSKRWPDRDSKPFYFEKSQYNKIHLFSLNKFLPNFLLPSRTTTYGRMVAAGSGALLIVGSFKKRFPDPDFKVRRTPT